MIQPYVMQSENQDITKRELLRELELRDLTDPGFTMFLWSLLKTALIEPDPENSRSRLQVMAALWRQCHAHLIMMAGIAVNQTPKTYTELADEIGIPRSTLWRWCHSFGNKNK